MTKRQRQNGEFMSYFVGPDRIYRSNIVDGLPGWMGESLFPDGLVFGLLPALVAF